MDAPPKENLTPSSPVVSTEGNPSPSNGQDLVILKGSELVPAGPGKLMERLKPRTLMPETVGDTFRLAEILTKSNIVPPPFQNNAANCFLAIEFAREMGIGWATVFQNSWPDKGRIKLFGNIILGYCRTCPAWEYIREEYDPKTQTATCTCKRKDDPAPVIRVYSYQMAATAGLTSKDNWKHNPVRMTQLRARNWALGDTYADWLNGMEADVEIVEISDIPPGTVGVVGGESLMPTSTDAPPPPPPQAKPMKSAAKPPVNAPPAPTPAAKGRVPISEIQRQELFKLLMKCKVKKDEWEVYLKGVGVKTTQELPSTIYGNTVQWIENHAPAKK